MTGDRRGTGWLIAMAGALLLGSLAAWAQPPKPGGTLRVGGEADVPGLDPHRAPSTAALRVLGNVFNSLLTFDAERSTVPDLAESWEILEHGKVYVFHLRKGVRFHDGTDFNAEVVRWNYRRLMPPDEQALHAPVDRLIEAVDALDAHTVRFTLTQPRRTLLPDLAASFTGVVQMSPASYQRWGPQEVQWHPVGTGPFQLAQWEPNHLLVFEKNPHYFKPGLPLSESHRMAHHPGWGDARHRAAGGRSGFRQRGPARPRGAFGQQPADAGVPGSRDPGHPQVL
jgi:ABC-type transport system substrate-binding protein